MDFLFKGKHENTQKWYYGDLMHAEHNGGLTTFIYDPKTKLKRLVIPATVGLCIDVADKNKNKFFVGDLFEYIEHKGYSMDSFQAVVVWIEEQACFGYRKNGEDFEIPFNVHDELIEDFLDYCTIIGNIHDTEMFI
jgi:hypothetical protein